MIKPFRSITSQISGEEYVTVSALKPLFHYLVNTLKDSSGGDIDAESTKQAAVGSTRAGTSSSVADVIKKAQNAILNDLSSRYQSSLVIMLLCSASFMDPRFKSLPFISTDFRVEIHENIKQLAIALVKNSKGSTESGDKSNGQAVGIGTDSSATGSGPARKKHKHEETWSVILGPMFNKEATSEDGNVTSLIVDALQQEVDKKFQKYLAEDLIAIDDNPLKWWKSNHFRFPTLSQVAKQLLCIPATSVPCERLFSTSGNIITPKRASLEPNTAGMLCFLAQNLPDK